MTDANTDTETDIDDGETDMNELAELVIDELDPGQTIGDKIMLSRRQVVAIAGGGLSLGALGTFGVSDAQAQSAVGTIGTSSSPVDVEAAQINAGSVNAEEINNAVKIVDPSENGSGIQSAINELSPTGGTVLLKQGTYEVSQTITIDSNSTRIVSQGDQSSKILATASLSTVFQVEGDSGTTGKESFTSFERVFIDCDGVADRAINTPTTGDVRGLALDRVKINNPAFFGIEYGGVLLFLSRVIVFGGGANESAVKTDSASHVFIDRVDLEDASVGLEILDTGQAIVSNSKFELNDTGVFVNNVKNRVTMSNCHAHDNNANGFSVSFSSGLVRFIGCDAGGNGRNSPTSNEGYGFAFRKSRDNRMVGCGNTYDDNGNGLYSRIGSSPDQEAGPIFFDGVTENEGDPSSTGHVFDFGTPRPADRVYDTVNSTWYRYNSFTGNYETI